LRLLENRVINGLHTLFADRAPVTGAAF